MEPNWLRNERMEWEYPTDGSKPFRYKLSETRCETCGCVVSVNRSPWYGHMSAGSQNLTGCDCTRKVREGR